MSMYCDRLTVAADGMMFTVIFLAGVAISVTAYFLMRALRKKHNELFDDDFNINNPVSSTKMLILLGYSARGSALRQPVRWIFRLQPVIYLGTICIALYYYFVCA